MHFSLDCSNAYDVPCAVAVLGHNRSLLSYECLPETPTKGRPQGSPPHATPTIDVTPTKGRPQGSRPTPPHPRPYKTLLANDTKTASDQHASWRGGGDRCSSR